MTLRCAVGHDSTEDDYCSVCGAAMGAAAVAGSRTGASVPGASSSVCPACSEPRADREARFCEVCRYDFLTARPGPAPRASGSSPHKATPPAPVVAPAVTAAPMPAPSSASVSSPLPAPAVAVYPAYTLVVQVDASLDVDPDAANPCPTGVADVVIPVGRADLLVGRRDDMRDVHPDIPVADPGTSRRHAKFVRAVDGTLAFLDLASTNGSKLNGVEVVPGSRSPLHPGDEITIGRWTRVRVTLP